MSFLIVSQVGGKRSVGDAGVIKMDDVGVGGGGGITCVGDIFDWIA
jgi:hypothetical protein